MNIVLNTPLPAFATKQEYDNKILFVFLILMSFLVMTGLVFVNFTKELSKNTPPPTVEEQNIPYQVGEYV